MKHPLNLYSRVGIKIIKNALCTKYVDSDIQFNHKQNNEKLQHGVTRWNQ